MALSSEALLIYFAMGQGKRLRIAHDGSGCTLVDPWSDFGLPPGRRGTREDLAISAPIPVNRAAVDELLSVEVQGEAQGNFGLLYRYTEQRVGDEISWLAGWREKGLDGTKADFYCLFHDLVQSLQAGGERKRG